MVKVPVYYHLLKVKNIFSDSIDKLIEKLMKILNYIYKKKTAFSEKQWYCIFCEVAIVHHTIGNANKTAG